MKLMEKAMGHRQCSVRGMTGQRQDSWRLRPTQVDSGWWELGWQAEEVVASDWMFWGKPIQHCPALCVCACARA